MQSQPEKITQDINKFNGYLGNKNGSGRCKSYTEFCRELIAKKKAKKAYKSLYKKTKKL